MTTERNRLSWLVGLLGATTLAVAVVWWPGCREYPPVSSPEALVLMKQLYTACNTRDPGRLERVEQNLERLAREGKVTPREQEAFRGIIAQARAGDWRRAEKASFKFAQDQVR